ncbi:MAG: hypothetical protein FD161_4320 [Limisphaerales bacterium]|nr:MAG: hypothetical protein FD161_4320 [Limisphaerales bacterium]KAG0507042.1 MAG: hypothetical protein E1N63_3828 [Limisphaerales bacterium]TXT49379.1 MAG: hypothetical protein FD140_3057 [Limisphaerales bacterium]
MSTVQEIKAAATKLSAEEKAELARWLTDQQKVETEAERLEWVRQWRELAAKANAGVGPITWKREDLYER